MIGRKWKLVSIVPIIIPVILFLAYTFVLLYRTWPIQEYSISKAGQFGDSFGVLTSLFSGLAFAGAIITMLLQKEQLVLNEKAQERNARLSAIPVLLNEYAANIEKLKQQKERRNQALEQQVKATQIGYDQNYLEVMKLRKNFYSQEENHPDFLELKALTVKRQNLYEELDSLVHNSNFKDSL